MTPEQAQNLLNNALSTPYSNYYSDKKKKVDFNGNRVSAMYDNGNVDDLDLRDVRLNMTFLTEKDALGVQEIWINAAKFKRTYKSLNVTEEKTDSSHVEIWIPYGSSLEQGQLLFDAFTVLVRRAQGLTTAVTETAVQPPAPKPAPNTATLQTKQQLLDALDTMQTQVAQVKAQRAALQPSKGALIAANVPAPVAERIQATQDKLAYTSLRDLYKSRATGFDGKEASIRYAGEDKEVALSNLLNNLDNFDSTKRAIDANVVKVLTDNYQRQGNQETFDVAFTVGGVVMRPDGKSVVTVTYPLRETWNVAANGARRMIETVYLGDGRNEIKWTPPSVSRVADAAKLAALGQQMFEQKRWADAEFQYREALKLNPDGNSGSYQNYVGVILSSRGKNEEKEPFFREAIRLNPQEAVYQNNLGTTLTSLKRYSEAEVSLREAVRLDATKASHRRDLAVALHNQEKYGQAEEQYREALRLDPQYGDAYANLAGCLWSQDRKDEARTMAQRAIALGYKDHWVYEKLGLTPPA